MVLKKGMRSAVAPAALVLLSLMALPSKLRAQDGPRLEVKIASARAIIYRHQNLKLRVTFENTGSEPSAPLVREQLIGPKSFVCAEAGPPGQERKSWWLELAGTAPSGTIGSLLPGETFISSVEVRLPAELGRTAKAVSIQWVGRLGDDQDRRSPELHVTVRDTSRPLAFLETGSGDMLIELDEEKAPNHVANFIHLAQQGFYDGLVFHRVFPNFIIQSGSPDGSPAGGPGYTIAAEPNDTPFRKGTVGLATVGDDPDTGGSQFFVCVADALGLNGKYTAFGRVLEGQDTADKISRSPSDGKGTPLSPVPITRVTLVLPDGYELPDVVKGGKSGKAGQNEGEGGTSSRKVPGGSGKKE